MGNHELNAIAYHTRHPETGEYLRPHTEKNRQQHAATRRCYAGHRDQPRSDLEWFKTLPMWLELDGLRVIHAAWLPAEMETIRQLDLQSVPDWPLEFPELFDPESALGAAVERLLKGAEWPLPCGVRFADKDGHLRSEVRVRWWEAASGKNWREVAFGGADLLEQLPDDPVPAEYPALSYPVSAPPVFVGHYWLSGTPKPLAPNVACLDYSVAKAGPLVAYRFDGESQLHVESFVAIRAEGAS
ncbi:hypothetical protein CKO15_13710 [Halorhodospira abdelmalekii]|nr:hypothetical protein [Halorhodospira abdelmalekii]